MAKRVASHRHCRRFAAVFLKTIFALHYFKTILIDRGVSQPKVMMFYVQYAFRSGRMCWMMIEGGSE